MSLERRPIIEIDEDKCDGCGLCATACHEGAIRIIDGKARLISESYCDGLGDCLAECPQGAITIEERKADGFILPRTFAEDARMRLLREMGVPFVLYGRVVDPEGCAWFDILGEDAMRDAVLRLVGHGHRRIGFVNGGAEYNFSRLRAAGFQDGLNRAGLTVDERQMLGGAMTREAGAAAAPTPPTCPGPVSSTRSPDSGDDRASTRLAWRQIGSCAR